MKIAVYTANIGNNVFYKEPDRLPSDIDHYYFTDVPEEIFNKSPKNSSYIFKRVTDHSFVSDDVCTSSRKLAKRIKIMFNEFVDDQYDWIVWIDAQRQFVRPDMWQKNYFEDFISCVPDNVDIIFKKHPKNKTVFEELNEVRDKKLDDLTALNDWREMLLDNGFDKIGHRLPETNLIFFRRKPNYVPLSFYEEWWHTSTNILRRDQLTINYLVHKYNINENLGITNLQDLFELKWISKTPRGYKEWSYGEVYR